MDNRCFSHSHDLTMSQVFPRRYAELPCRTGHQAPSMLTRVHTYRQHHPGEHSWSLPGSTIEYGIQTGKGFASLSNSPSLASAKWLTSVLVRRSRWPKDKLIKNMMVAHRSNASINRGPWAGHSLCIVKKVGHMYCSVCRDSKSGYGDPTWNFCRQPGIFVMVAHWTTFPNILISFPAQTPSTYCSSQNWCPTLFLNQFSISALLTCRGILFHIFCVQISHLPACQCQ